MESKQTNISEDFNKWSLDVITFLYCLYRITHVKLEENIKDDKRKQSETLQPVEKNVQQEAVLDPSLTFLTHKPTQNRYQRQRNALFLQWTTYEQI